MIETSLYDYLNTKQGIPLYLESPKVLPSKYYLMEKTGGNMENHIRHSTIIIQSCAATLYDAAVMNEDIISLMLYDAVTLADVASISLNSNYNYTDPTTRQHRYQAVFDVVHY